MALLDVFLILGAMTLFVLVLTLGGVYWLWRVAPTRASAEAVASLVRAYWVTSLALASVAFGGFWFSGDFLLWGLPFPFLLPAVTATLYYRRTFQKTGVVLEILRRQHSGLGE